MNSFLPRILRLPLLFAGVVLAIHVAARGGTITGITWTQAQLVSGESAAHVVAGPDGNAWATEQAKGQILKIAVGGSVTRYPLPAGTTPFQITSGPDGNLWFSGTQSNASITGKITTSGVVTIFPYPDPAAFRVQTSGPIAGSSDGFVYVLNTGSDKLGKITPATGAVTEVSLPGALPYDIAALSDGSLAITDNLGGAVERVVGGVVTKFSRPSPLRVSPCRVQGSPGFCVTEFHGFQDNVMDECTLNNVCTPYTVQTNQCSAQGVGCSSGDCFLTTPFCQEVVHLDMTQTPPGSNIIAAPAGFTTDDIQVLPTGVTTTPPGNSGVWAVGQDSNTGDFRVFYGLITTGGTSPTPTPTPARTPTPTPPKPTITPTPRPTPQPCNPPVTLGAPSYAQSQGFFGSITFTITIPVNNAVSPYQAALVGLSAFSPQVSTSPSMITITMPYNSSIPNGNYSYTVTVTDARRCTASESDGIRVGPGLSPQEIDDLSKLPGRGPGAASRPADRD